MPPTRFKSSHDYETKDIVETLREAADDIEEGGARSFYNLETVPHDDIVKRTVSVSFHVPVEEE